VNWIGAYVRVTISAEAKILTVSMATFCDNKQALFFIFSMFLQLPIHRKTDHHSGKTIVEAGNSQRSKG